MDISKKQAKWRKERPLFEAELIHSHLLPSFDFNENTGDYEIKPEIVSKTDDEDRKVAYETLNTGWAMWLRAKASAVPEWVSVDERLPDGYVQVLAINNKGVIRVAEHAFYEEEWRKAPSLKTAKHPITHWMPLPEAPKAQELSND